MPTERDVDALADAALSRSGASAEALAEGLLEGHRKRLAKQTLRSNKVSHATTVRMIKPSGYVANVVVNTNRGKSLADQDRNYRTQRILEFQQAGGFLYDEPPPGMGISAEMWPAVREKLIAKLRARYDEYRAQLPTATPEEIEKAKATFKEGPDAGKLVERGRRG